MPQRAYYLSLPQKRSTSVVFASPHSGRDYPDGFLRRTRLDRHRVRSSEDAFVDDLFDGAPRTGASLLCAGAPRAFVDFNRAADELDPALIEGVRTTGHNPRITSGLGVIPRVVANGKAIYTGKITLEEARQRIDRYWRPYHQALQGELDQAYGLFGQAILIDCHSMPHEAMESATQSGTPRAQVVLGDRFGASAQSGIVEQIEAAFQAADFIVARNVPFAGAYTTQHYGRPARNRHAIQIEIDRALYMDEKRITPRADYAAFKARLHLVIASISDIGRPRTDRLAAE